MNEKPGDTPNPLNAAPDGASQPATTPAEAATPVEPVAPVAPQPAAPVDPMARPMEKAPEPEVVPAPKKKKVGLIVGIIVVALVIIGGIVAAILLLNMNRGDAVAKAMNKIMSGNAPENVRLDGTFDVTVNDESSQISSIKLTLNADATTNSMINSSAAQITATLKDFGNISIDFSEVYAENGGDLYLKVDGAKTALEDYANFVNNSATSTVTETEETVIAGETEETEVTSVDIVETVSAFSDIIGTMDGQWLRISAEELSSFENTTEDGQTACVVDLANNIKNYSNSIAEMYANNPFVSSTTEGVTLASKNGGPVYKVIIDQEKLSGFMSALKSSDLATNLSSCMSDENATADMDELSEELNTLPVLYVEVDNDYNFTRLVFDANLSDGEAALSTDLGFSYPENVNIAEPAEYKDLSTILEQLLAPVESDTNTIVVE